MRSRFPAVQVRYLGQAVNLPEAPQPARLLACKAASRALLFIGDAKYLAGARVLLEAFTRLRAGDPGLSLDFIGLEARQLGPLPPGVTCHGYLDKGRPVELARYRALLESARILVNTTPHWGAFSSLLEALYCSTPLVVAPYEEFVRIFGRELPFGLYCEPNRPDLLADRLSRLLAHGDYPALARAAHAAVADFTWANFTGHLLTEIEALG
jgi:glycosyltransferase involved in cell wall biosynthesis